MSLSQYRPLVLSSVVLLLGGCPAPETGDDTSPPDSVSPCEDGGAPSDEVCDGLDNDCDGDIDEGLTLIRWYTDADGDNYGDPATETRACDAPSDDAVTVAGDCDDSDATLSPGAEEVCDGVDNDCDDLTDDADPDVTDQVLAYADQDGDGYGTEPGFLFCEVPSGHAAEANDCDDTDPKVNEPTAWYTDADADGYGAGEPEYSCDRPSGTVDNAEDCDDDDRRVSPSITEVCGDGVDNDCDGGPNDCHPYDGTYAPSDAGARVDSSLSYFGVWFDGADLDGDGHPDLMTASPYGGSGYGAVYGFGGLDEGDSLTISSATSLLSAGSSDSAYTGWGASAVGDLDRDGYTDVGLGWSSGPYLTLHEGPFDASGTSTEDFSTLLTGLTYVSSIYTFLDGDDLDGDGVSDLAIGDYQATISYSYEGAVWLLGDGVVDGKYDLSELATARIEGEKASAYLGRSVDIAGDTDGDGVQEVIAGAYYYAGGVTGSGAAMVIAGDARGSLGILDADTVVYGTAAGSYAGSDVSGAGDVNGDGYADVLISAYLDASFTGSSTNANYLFLGPLPSGILGAGSADAAFYTTSAERGAWRVGRAGDLDADGNDDIVLGSYYHSSYAGSVLVYYGGYSSGSYSEKDAGSTIVGSSASSYFGLTVGGVGDLNEDGFDDLAVNAYGSQDIFLFFGSGL